jgi:glucosylceramidase
MKSNNYSVGGQLLPKYYQVYADYLLRFIKEYKQVGIEIDALTIQNEPLHPGNNPSLLMLPMQQAEFIKNYLGPTFKKAKCTTKIIIYDHNADRPDYALEILNDNKAKKYVDGTAFHLYGGQIENLSQVHDLHPDKNIYFTEQWIGAPGNFEGDMQWHIKNLIINGTRNWAKTVLEWNLAADKNQSMHTIGGCTECLGAITIDENLILRNPAYYIIAHASKFVVSGSKRIYSNTSLGLNNVAFLTPDNKVVMILYNENDSTQEFFVSLDGKNIKCKIGAKSIATVVL